MGGEEGISIYAIDGEEKNCKGKGGLSMEKETMNGSKSSSSGYFS